MKQDFTELGADRWVVFFSTWQNAKMQGCRISVAIANPLFLFFFFFSWVQEDFEDETLEKRGCRLYAKRSRKLRRNTFRS